MSIVNSYPRINDSQLTQTAKYWLSILPPPMINDQQFTWTAKCWLSIVDPPKIDTKVEKSSHFDHAFLTLDSLLVWFPTFSPSALWMLKHGKQTNVPQYVSIHITVTYTTTKAAVFSFYVPCNLCLDTGAFMVPGSCAVSKLLGIQSLWTQSYQQPHTEPQLVSNWIASAIQDYLGENLGRFGTMKKNSALMSGRDWQWTNLSLWSSMSLKVLNLSYSTHPVVS